MPLSLLLPLILQLGPGGALPQAPLPVPAAKSRPAAAPEADPGRDCLHLAMTRPAEAIPAARKLLSTARTGAQRAGARQCQGLALARTENWSEAAVLFLLARDDTPAGQQDERARLGALAGNARLAAGDAAGALTALDLAQGDSASGTDRQLRAGIAVDRARALVALGRADEADAALAAARLADPDNPQAWLLSATLSRRQGNLTQAQTQIETAARLLPVDPEIGLEAGVIAVLSGREEAARKSWQSVVTVAPDSPAAASARQYLDQLGPSDAPSPR